MANKDSVSFDELVSALKQMNEKIGSLSYYLFAIKYGKYLKDQNLTEIIRSANLTESMSKELSKGLRLYNILSNNDFGLALKESGESIVLSQDSNNNLPLDKLADYLYQMEAERKGFGIGATATAFGFKYGKAISVGNYSCGSIIDEATKRHPDFGLTHTHDATIKYGVDLHQMFENSSFGLHFTKSRLSKSYCNISTKTNNKHLSYLTAFRTKPFMLLAGISGTGKSRIVREFAFKCCPKELQDKDGTTPGNYCMVEVKPNWHDSTELLGYWSNLQEKYMFTKFVKFLVKAKMYPSVPFFVCLDEMNLAPVEQYFAEFLSVLETRRIVKDDETEKMEIKSGALVDKDYFKTFGAIGGQHLENDRQIYFKLFNINEREEMEKTKCESKSLLEEGLTLPENVFIIGTVNMDDTTHQFSRKVIDRAMTIEMNGGALADIFKQEEGLTYAENPLTMEYLRSKYVTAKEVIANCEAVLANEEISKYIQGINGEGLPQRLQAINMVLAGTPFTVSYRVMNELTIYLAVLLDKAAEDGKEVNFDTFMPYVETAIDKILLMKILPRVEGDDEMFRVSEKERNANGLDSQVNEDGGMSHEFTKLDWLKQIAPRHTEENKDEYMAVDKLSEMIDRLNRQSFTRYWP